MPQIRTARWKALLALSLLPALTGCVTTRSVMKTHPPAQVLSSTLDAITKSTTDRYNSINSFTASVDVVASAGGGKNGTVTQYPAFTAIILLRKPEDLHFVLFAPVVHVKALDMVTDGKTFTVIIPSKSKVITGSNNLETPSSNPLENLRPAVFTDSMLIRSPRPDELVSLTSDERIYQPDPTKKIVVDEPEYDLGVYRTVPGSTELKTQRVIHIGRSSLLPYQQDIYDEKGQLVTVANYDDYKLFGETTFPGKITTRRPQDQLSLVLTVTKLAVNQKLDDDQFQNSYPSTYTVQKLP